MFVFLILHYKVYEETIKCVNSILYNIKNDKKVLIVDNFSNNGSAEKLCSYYEGNPSVEVIKTEQNLGFANGNNYGYKYIKEKYKQVDFICCMNNDMEIKQNNFIEETINAYQKYEFDILGPDIFSTKTLQHQNPVDKNFDYNLKKLESLKLELEIKLKFSFLIKIKNILKKYKEKAKKQEVLENYVENVKMNVPLHGSCYIFSKKYINKYDECFYNKTFMYMEAEILYYIIKRDNLISIYYPYIKVMHHEDVSTNHTYNDNYKKAIFVNKCLIESYDGFIQLIKNLLIKINSY